MDILNEIVEVSNQMIDSLEENDFFVEAPFIDRIPLKRALQIPLYEKEFV